MKLYVRCIWAINQILLKQQISKKFINIRHILFVAFNKNLFERNAKYFMLLHSLKSHSRSTPLHTLKSIWSHLSSTLNSLKSMWLQFSGTLDSLKNMGSQFSSPLDSLKSIRLQLSNTLGFLKSMWYSFQHARHCSCGLNSKY